MTLPTRESFSIVRPRHGMPLVPTEMERTFNAPTPKTFAHGLNMNKTAFLDPSLRTSPVHQYVCCLTSKRNSSSDTFCN